MVTTLFVGNLDRRVTEASIARVFKPYGDIRRIQFMWHQSGPRRGEPRGFSFVEFATRAQALAAKSALDGKPLLGRPLRVRFEQARVAVADASAVTAGVGAGALATTGSSSAASSSGGALGGKPSRAEQLTAIELKMEELRRQLGLKSSSAARSMSSQRRPTTGTGTGTCTVFYSPGDKT